MEKKEEKKRSDPPDFTAVESLLNALFVPLDSRSLVGIVWRNTGAGLRLDHGNQSPSWQLSTERKLYTVTEDSQQIFHMDSQNQMTEYSVINRYYFWMAPTRLGSTAIPPYFGVILAFFLGRSHFSPIFYLFFIVDFPLVPS